MADQLLTARACSRTPKIEVPSVLTNFEFVRMPGQPAAEPQRRGFLVRFVSALSRPFVVFVERYYPDPFVFLIVLTGVAFALAMSLTDSSVSNAIYAWGEGLSGLLAFMAQIALTLLTAHALAHTDAVRRGLAALARLPTSIPACYALVVIISCTASLLAWSFGLVAGALIARAVAEQAKLRGLAVHYPLLVAGAYCGLGIWHMGYSGSAPLFVATPGHAMESYTGVLPVSATLFSHWNLIGIVTTVLALAAICPMLHPQSSVRGLEEDNPDADKPANSPVAPKDDSIVSGSSAQTPAMRIDSQRGLTLAFGALLAIYLGNYFFREGFALNLNIVNWSFLTLGLLLARSPVHYVDLILDAGKTVGAVFIQYPFYAGIMGLMTGTGLVQVMAHGFTEIATAQTLGFWAFLAGGLVNLFIPSGGGQWAVQGPVFLEAAKTLGTDPSVIVMGIAYGDQWTNLIQPFWTIPLLAIAGLHMRDIMGYCFVLFLVAGITLGATILYAGTIS